MTYIIAFILGAALAPFMGPLPAIAIVILIFVWKSCRDLLRLLDKLDAQERERKRHQYESD